MEEQLVNRKLFYLQSIHNNLKPKRFLGVHRDSFPKNKLDSRNNTGSKNCEWRVVGNI